LVCNKVLLKMDYKQKKIYHNICKNNNIPIDSKFKQFRNLLEFRFFRVERVNPNHHIIIYGKLKHKQVKDNYYNKYIRVGEIFITSGFIFYTLNDFLLDLIIQFFTGLVLFYLFYLMFIEYSLKRVLYTYWYRLNNSKNYKKIPIKV
jgi:hypothetical protein